MVMWFTLLSIPLEDCYVNQMIESMCENLKLSECLPLSDLHIKSKFKGVFSETDLTGYRSRLRR